jgi:hypothetical protein
MRLRNTILMTIAAIAASVLFAAGSAEAAKQCMPCEPGKYSTGGGECQWCPSNYYCPGGLDKQSCGPNRTTPASGITVNGVLYRATSLADCKTVCAAGQYYNGAICQSCPAGTYQSATSHTNTSCNSCASGLTTPSIGATSGSQCCNSTSWSFLSKGTGSVGTNKLCTNVPGSEGTTTTSPGSSNTGSNCWCKQQNGCGDARWYFRGEFPAYCSNESENSRGESHCLSHTSAITHCKSTCSCG